MGTAKLSNCQIMTYITILNQENNDKCIYENRQINIFTISYLFSIIPYYNNKQNLQILFMV